MDTRRFLYLFVVLLIIILGVFGYFYWQAKKQAELKSLLKQEKVEDVTPEFMEAVDNQDSGLCLKIKDTRQRDGCLLIASQSIADCEKIKNTKELLEDCYINVFKKGILKKEAECASLPKNDLKNYCLALIGGDSRFCEEIGDESQRNYCLIDLSRSLNDERLCAKVHLNYKNSCLNFFNPPTSKNL